MNKIVRRLYPIDQLPKDLRVGLPDHGWVRIELNPEDNDAADAAPIAALAGTGPNVHGDLVAVLKAVEATRQDR